MSEIIHGGLELKSEKITSILEKRKVTNFDPVLSMLIEPTSTLGLITASSLKGFIFSLHVPKNTKYTEYDSTTDGQLDVENFALKIVIISNEEERLLDFNGKRKYTETGEGFRTEADMQQTIWKQSYLTNGGEIAPSVGNITFLEGYDGIIKLLETLKYHINTTSEAIEALNFLISVYKNNNNNNLKLGILLMKNYS